MASTKAIVGSKGGGGKSSTAKSGGTANTLRSKARARLLDLIGEGPLESVLVNGDRSIYFDETPVRDDLTDALNFEGVVFETRSGLPDQTHINGLTQVETPYSVDVRVKKNTSAPVRTITDTDADAVRVIIRIPSLVNTNREEGTLESTSVSYAIDVRPSGGAWVEMVLQNIVNQKTTSSYEKAHRIVLPVGGAPWDLRVRRITEDSEIVELQNETWWSSYFVLVEGKFIYPNSALVSIEVDSELFGNSLPPRSYHVKGLKISVPDNYDPVTLEYTGIWDGTFKTAWTRNPAWVLYDLLINNRYGLGESINVDHIDKWGLYQIAQYCDELVPSGLFDEDSEIIYEPRYTFDGVINRRVEAFLALRQIATAFRGMAYWSLNQVAAIADMPSDPVKLVTPANVKGGNIDYAGSGMRARHSVALVTWNNPAEFDRPTIEVVIDDEALAKFGWRELPIQAVGCRSRGLATRYGRWALFTEKHETEVATYEASWDHANARPGDVVAIADPAKAEIRHGGRLVAVSGSELTLDAGFTPAMGETYSIMVQLPDGSLSTLPISFTSPTVVEVDGAFATAPVPGAMWVITGTDIAPRTFRVLSVVESEPHLFKVSAVQHHPGKYAQIEGDYQLSPIPYRRPSNTILAPTNIVASESLHFRNGAAKAKLTIAWNAIHDFMTHHYRVWANHPTLGFMNLGDTNDLFTEIEDSVPGDWTFHVAAVSMSGVVSPVAQSNYTATGWEGVDPPYVSHLEIFGGNNTGVFGGRHCRITWRNNFPGSSFDWGTEPAGSGSGSVNPFYRDNLIRVWDVETGELLRTDVVAKDTYTYTYEHNAQDNERLGQGPLRRFRFDVTCRDNLGRESAPAKLVVNNPVPEIIIPTVTAGIDVIHVNYTLPVDIDFAGVMVWVSPTEEFDPEILDAVYVGGGNSITLAATPFETVYVQIAPYDAFGAQDLAYSAVFEVTPGDDVLDATPPAVPTGLDTDAAIELSVDGIYQSVLTSVWDVSPSANFANYEVEIRPAGGAFIGFTTGTPNFEWRNLPFNTTFEIRVRAISRNGFASAYCTIAEQLVPINAAAPDVITGLSAVASLRSAFLKWVNPLDKDLATIEIWSSLTNNRLAATLVGSSRSSAFAHTGLSTGVTRYYWARALNSSGITGAWNAGDTSGVSVTPGEVQEGDIAVNSINADHVQAGSIDGTHVSVSADLAPTITVNGSGISLGDMTEPADLVNAQTTQIQPGKILISGATSLANWRNGTDATKIEGGAIAANTVAANLVTVGLRGIDVAGIQFEANSGTHNLTWTAGVIAYTNDAGASATAAITAGNVTWASGTRYVYWVKGATTLSTSTTRPVGANDVILATYRGTLDLVVTYGRTIVDGAHIVTDSIVTNLIRAGAIVTDRLAVGGVETDRVANDAVSAISSTLTTGGTSISGSGGEAQTATITRRASTELDLILGFEVDSKDSNSLICEVKIKRDGTTLHTITVAVCLYYIVYGGGGSDNHAGFLTIPYLDSTDQTGSKVYSYDLRFYNSSGNTNCTVRNRYLRVWERKK